MMFTCMMAMLSAGELSAENNLRLDTLKTVLQVRRPALESVRSLDISPEGVIDTLDTANDCVKVILYSDNTWKYHKTPDFQQSKDVFEKYWDETTSNPYKMSVDSLPYSWTIWLVDSLDQFRCPYQGDIHPRGKFGVRRGRRHQGIDIPLKTGEPIYASGNGKVVEVSYNFFGYGKEVVIDHGFGYKTRYAHLSEIFVKEGDMVVRGDQIGGMGNSGRSSGCHLHYEVLYRNSRVNPLNYYNSEVKGEEYISMVNPRSKDDTV